MPQGLTKNKEETDVTLRKNTISLKSLFILSCCFLFFFGIWFFQIQSTGRTGLFKEIQINAKETSH